jgi:hypothetical protein
MDTDPRMDNPLVAAWRDRGSNCLRASTICLLTKLVNEAPSWHDITPDEGLNDRASVLRNLKAAVPIRIQNVADYLILETDQYDFDLSGDFPKRCAAVACLLHVIPDAPVSTEKRRAGAQCRRRAGVRLPIRC